MHTLIRPEADPIWHKLTNAQRREVSLLCEMIRIYDAAPDKAAALDRIRFEYEPQLGYPISRSTFLRKRKAVADSIIVAALGRCQVRIAQGVVRASRLPPAFVSWLRSLCGDMQREKFLSVFKRMITELRMGTIIPGYDTDWRGIYASENPGCVVPAVCPYNEIIERKRGGRQPSGWSYSNLIKYAPEPDVAAGAAVGVHSMRAYNPVVPHTRYGMRPVMCLTVDDVDPDVYCHYEGETEARRPIGLGVMDVATGCVLGFTLVPRRKDRETGKVSGLQAFWARYLWANVFCGIGIDREAGLMGLLEHGTASLSDDDVFRINRILGPGPKTDAPASQNPFAEEGKGVWFVVLRSSTSGAPIMKGLFNERASGIPTWKAPIESVWNLMHNEAAFLPGQSGRNWETAPKDIVGWQREDKALVEFKRQLSTCPQAVEILHRAQTYALSYRQLDESFKAIFGAINNRHEHHIQEYEKCGYVHSVVDVGGSLVPLEQAAESVAGGDAELRKSVMAKLAERQKIVLMSPMEAFKSYPETIRVKFGGFQATQILGDELSQVVTVDRRSQFVAVNHWSGEAMLYSAMVDGENGVRIPCQPGDVLRVWVNPTNVNYALVCRESGVYLGRAAYMAPAPFHRPQDAEKALGEVAKHRSEQMRRLASVVGGRQVREAERRAENARALAEAASLAGRAAQSQLEEMAGEPVGEIEDL